ncbi:MAG: AAA family ATPase [Prevotella sp.]|nr:AAA family ATPase [Prevotella sp.]
MPAQYDLFTTNPGTSGYRLSYMELFNWGTFHNKVYRIEPRGNNSLLTGANASGKSTLIDALLTLLVPAKKDRFYNQSSGNEKKGDRTEETYVLGYYGNMQSEGEASTRKQQLRDKNTYSVILASFTNNFKNVVTLFQVRWFVNGELKCTFGFSTKALHITDDFSTFDAKGYWRKTLDRKYNVNVPKKQIEFYDTIKDYKDRIVHSMGLRSDKALTLFNQIVGVKVLNDLDDFIRNNMLEQRDTEEEYNRLNDSFARLIEARTTIEKVSEQIGQLKPIDEKAKQLDNIAKALSELQTTREMAVCWFAQKNKELANTRITELNEKLAGHKKDLELLNQEREELKAKESTLRFSIESDDVGRQIRLLKEEINRLEQKKKNRLSKLEEYNKKALEVGFDENPTEQVFIENREMAKTKRDNCQLESDAKHKELGRAEIDKEQIKEKIDENIKTLDILKKNNNNISGRVAEIREMILQEIHAKAEEVPFIGELIRVKNSEKAWENSIEKILHNFALRLVVPEKYYRQVSQYVNSHDLQGRIVYQRYENTASLKSFQFRDYNENSLIEKIEFNPNSIYSEWVKDIIIENYNYICVEDLDEFYRYGEKVVTKEGLIKSTHNKHEKDDRPQINRRENFVLGWDNKEKIAAIKEIVRGLQDDQKQNANDIREINTKIKEIGKRKDCFDDIFKLFTKYEEINWEETARTIQEKKEEKENLEAANSKLKELQEQLQKVQTALKTLEDVTIKSKDREIYQIEQVELVTANKRLVEAQSILNTTGVVDVSSFEGSNPDILGINYDNSEERLNSFQSNIKQQEEEKKEEKNRIEREVSALITQFKNPSEEILKKYRDWRSDVHTLPDAQNLHLISDYQTFYEKLKKEDLVRHEQRFNSYLHETLTNQVSSFRMFFVGWEKSIRDTIEMLNKSLKAIDFSSSPSTYIQLVNFKKANVDIAEFRKELEGAIPNIREVDSSIDGRRNHFEQKIQPLIQHLRDEQWRKKVMDVRNWYSYRAEEFYKETGQKRNVYESMGQLSGGEKAQLTYTILGSAIAYQFGLTKDGLQSNSLRFIAIDEAFKAQDEDKARYLISLCKQLHLQLLVVTPSDNIHIVENDISFVHYVERNGNESRLFDMPIEIFKEEREKFLANDNAS